jgi:hypothetical protein
MNQQDEGFGLKVGVYGEEDEAAALPSIHDDEGRLERYNAEQGRKSERFEADHTDATVHMNRDSEHEIEHHRRMGLGHGTAASSGVEPEHGLSASRTEPAGGLPGTGEMRVAPSQGAPAAATNEAAPPVEPKSGTPASVGLSEMARRAGA